ncbi:MULTISPECIES: peroxiredoxin [Aquimarina]|uniref:thioredoxin-dependent peroxiredoxin n=1 Tax=Aquimarina algiphila TaxID=2047982 RepID=A0A554VAH2_9FLAO|nr:MULTISPECIES: peroxiredoxin [Aquimarina]TSE03127.1 peroxiredoxin [Aquimarina algiphila]
MGLKVGDKVPEFSAVRDNGEDFQSSDIIGKEAVVIYFYPKNFTPGCTKEACDFRDSYADFKSLGAEVIGVSSDGIKSHTRFKKKYNLPYTFLSDSKGKLKRLFGVKSELLGLLPGRETYVIDKEGIVQLKFNSMNASKHLGKAIAKIKEIMAV